MNIKEEGMSGSVSTSPTTTQQGVMDPLDSLLDLSEYDNAYKSPSMSSSNGKSPFISRQPSIVTTQPLISSQPVMSGPSHQYDAYKQQTGIVPGALANTFAINQNNSQVTGYSSFSLDNYLGVPSTDDMWDFNASPSQDSPDMELDLDFDSPTDFFGESTINPANTLALDSSSLASPLPPSTSNVGRLWPGMHQQAALAKAQQQQRAQQQLIQQQSQRPAAAKPTAQRKGAQPSDPIVEQKITQLLNSMRAKPSIAGADGQPTLNVPRLKKDEEDMDEDERLLASEEGKKLSSKERRQLRNKVSARAFRSRRKEYITQLEGELASKVNENGELKAQNRALLEENKRLSDLTRMLLSSPSFSDFLDRLSSTSGSMLPSPQSTQDTTTQQQQAQSARQERQLPKDVNPYVAAQQLAAVNGQQQIGMAMIPEQAVDFSMLSLDASDFSVFRPQVFTAVLDTPPAEAFDVAALSGKAPESELDLGIVEFDEEKATMPMLEHPPAVQEKEAPAPVETAPAESHEDSLYDVVTAPTEESTVVNDIAVFGDIEPGKALSHIALVDAAEDEADEEVATRRIWRLVASLEAVSWRLDGLSLDS